MHLTLLRSQKAKAAGKTSAGSYGKKGANGAWVHVHFHQHVPGQGDASRSPQHSPQGLRQCNSGTCCSPVGTAPGLCGGSTTVLETTAGPSLYWYNTARNKEYQNWRSFNVHLLIGPVLRKHGCQSSSDLACGQCPRSPSWRRRGQAGSNIAFPWALPPEGLTWAGQQHWDCFNTYS